MDAERIAAENLGIWREAAAQNRELRRLQLAQLAAAVDPAGMAEPSPALLPHALREEAYGALPAEMRAEERVAFCAALAAVHPTLHRERAASDPPAIPRVAILSGPVFASALSRFFKDVQTKPVSLSSLTELLEEVSTGNADFALLPMEDAKGARLLHFYEEFDRLELRVIGLCRVPATDEGRGLRFALLTRYYDPPAPAGAELLLECRLTCEGGDAITELLHAARGVGLTLRRIDSLPDPYLENGTTYFSVFSGPAQAQEQLEVYLALCLPRAAVIGRYFLLTEETQ